ncbi:MAG: DUF5668 domain-containing protein [Cyclobacteriaceae bacterium]
MGKSDNSSKAWLGIVLVALGGYFLLRNLDLIPSFIPYYFFGWEMILVIVGGAMLTTGRREGFIFLAIGGLFLLPEIFYLPRFRFRDWWPIVLIIIGVSIVIRRRGFVVREEGDIDEDFIDDTSIFGGSEKSFNSKNFKGGKVTSIFGGSKIDFSDSKMAPEGAVLDMFCLFGGNELVIPNDWTIVNESFVIFGGYADKRSRSATEQNDPKKLLKIKGSVIFGGSEVKGA